MAGLIVCPEPVLPAEWLPMVWGGENGLAELDGADEIDRTAPDLIHSMVRHLTAWKSARPLHRIGPGDIVFDDPPAHGRNAGSDEPCPCGSGRTCGRCCGAH